MIRCPYCRNRLTETSNACPDCSLDLAKLRKHLGPFPLVAGGLSDAAKVLTRRETSRLRSASFRFNRRFPQSRLHIVLRIFQVEIPFSALLFYIFNTSGLSEESSRSSKNRDILLVLDPLRKEAGLMVGYGLEPFIPQEGLDDLLHQNQPLFASGETVQALLNIIEGLTELLSTLSREISENLGLTDALNPVVGEFDY